MAFLALALAFLFQTVAPSTSAPFVPAPSAEAQTAPAPVRPRPWPETGPSTVYFAYGSTRVVGEGLAVEILASANHSGPQAANRRLAQRRARAVADALVRSGSPRAVIAVRPVGEDEPQVMTPDGVPDPFDRYARIIFPVPPPR